MLRHLHVTDINERAAYSVNTFDRVMRGVEKPIAELPHVLHLHNGRPGTGVVVGKRVHRGRETVEVISPARGPRGTFVKNVAVDPGEIFPDSAPLPEARNFLGALSRYRHNPNDYYWNQANKALDEWMTATEAAPPRRGQLRFTEEP